MGAILFAGVGMSGWWLLVTHKVHMLYAVTGSTLWALACPVPSPPSVRDQHCGPLARRAIDRADLTPSLYVGYTSVTLSLHAAVCG